MYSIAVIALSKDKKTKEIYDAFKAYIPDELKSRSDYQYNDSNFITYVPIPITSEAFQQLESTAIENRIFSHKHEITEYTKEEVENAEYVQMLVSEPLESEGTYARDYGTKYTNCCQACQIGGDLIGDVKVDRKFVKKYSIASLRPDIFVSKQVKWLIEENGLTGVSFEHKVVDYKGREIPEYYVMTFDSIMPPMDSRTWFTFDPYAKFCPVCNKKIPYLRSHCYYKKSDFINAKDFNLSYEAFDNFAQQAIIVSKKTKDIFKKYKIRCGYYMLNVIE